MTENSSTLPSYAKINWRLRILGRRDDGFHELCTIFQTVSLFDEITFEADERLTLSCGDPNIPTDETNLISRAARRLKKEYGVDNGARIHLEKRIPAPGGLGGGSSNAAVALLGLAALWQLEIKFDDFIRMGSELGSDVPFFFYGGTACGTGRGTEITPLKDLRENLLLIVTPDVHVPTAEAFARANAPRLTNETSKVSSKFAKMKPEASIYGRAHWKTILKEAFLNFSRK